MKTIHRAISVELLQTFLLALVALNLVLMTEKMLMLTRLLASVGASLADIALILLYLQPQIAVLTIPMAFLLSTLLTYGRLNTDSELVVMRSAGMSLAEISRPVFMMGSACFAVGIALSLVVSPASSRKLGDTVSDVISQRAPYAIEEGIFNTSLKGMVVFANEKPDMETLRGVFLYDERNPGRPAVMFASEARISGAGRDGISLELKDGSINILREDTATEVSFGRYLLTLAVDVQAPSRKQNELSAAELLKEARTGRPKDRTRMVLEFHRRLTLPFVCLALMFLGPPLSLLAGRAGRLGGLSIGLLVFAAYYGALMYGESLVGGGKVPHYIGAWAPPAALWAVSVYVFARAGRR